MAFSCDKNVYLITIDVLFSGKPPKDQYPFTLKLSIPDKLQFKCMLDYPKSQIYCFHAFSDEEDFIEENANLQFPYPFPELEDIEWDYETFLQKIYRKVWTSNTFCGKQDIFNKTSPYYENWKIEGKIAHLENGKCKTAMVSKEDQHKYIFDMRVSFEKGEIIELLKDVKGKNNADIELMQEIWVPLLPSEEKRAKTRTYQRNFAFAYCSSNNKITQVNYANFTLNCYLPIKTNTIFNGVIRISSFFDKIYIRQNNRTNIASTYIEVSSNNIEPGERQEKTYITLDEKDQGIICPNQPMFTIDTKDEITMGLYYPESNKYTFFLTGTLTNGYYVFKNGTTVELNETYKDISFNLVVEDELLDTDENERNVTCLLPSGSPFNIKNEAIIKCIGTKDYTSNQNKNVDISLYWDVNTNNNFNDIMITWPKTYDESSESNKKNIYGYELTGLSIRQSNFGCHNNNFDFYVYIYNLYSEPKLIFDLPLSMPKNYDATCELFDQTALKCTLNLKHKKLFKGEKVMLPSMGTENEIITDEGNRIVFKMNNYSTINNDHDFFVTLEESCGDYMVVGTLKDMGMSHKTSVIRYVLIIVFICLFIVGLILYIAYKIRMRYKRGAKLTTSEETRDNSASNQNATNVKL